jgi:hypothetical protein
MVPSALTAEVMAQENVHDVVAGDVTCADVTLVMKMHAVVSE